jgi:hypothetical protein
MGPTGGGMHVGPGHPFFTDRWATATTADLSMASVACPLPQKVPHCLQHTLFSTLLSGVEGCTCSDACRFQYP